MKLIDKDALIAEIKARISDIEVSQKAGMIKKCDADKKILLFKSVLSLIDTLEVKEVDFETTFAALIDHFDEKNSYGRWSEFDLRQFAKQFFELGMIVRNKPQKGVENEM